MTSSATAFLCDLTNAVRDAAARTSGLATVHLAGGPGIIESAQLPAATLGMTELKDRPAGTPPLDGLAQVRYALTLWRRDGDVSANVGGLHQLADSAIAALLADPTLGGRAVGGPGGSATEITDIEPGKGQAPPLGSLVLRFFCWIVSPAALTPMPTNSRVLIDGQPLLATGPHTLTVSDWQRRRVDRQFAGLDGTVSIDLGATHRPMNLAGRLVASTTAALLAQVQTVEGLSAASVLHQLTAPDGRTFSNVRLDQVRWGRLFPASGGRPGSIGYEISVSQLGVTA